MEETKQLILEEELTRIGNEYLEGVFNLGDKFREYLDSEERILSYVNNPEFPNQELLQERLSQVSHADVENFKEKYATYINNVDFIIE